MEIFIQSQGYVSFWILAWWILNRGHSLYVEEEENDDWVNEENEEAFDDVEEPTSAQAATVAADEQQFLRSYAHLWKDDDL